jgi:hypothetical protein
VAVTAIAADEVIAAATARAAATATAAATESCHNYTRTAAFHGRRVVRVALASARCPRLDVGRRIVHSRSMGRGTLDGSEPVGILARFQLFEVCPGES